MLLLGLVSMGLGQAWLSQITAGGSYEVNVLPGVMLPAFRAGARVPDRLHRRHRGHTGAPARRRGRLVRHRPAS